MIPADMLPADVEWCIAGGYAACPALAGDIDVWVYGVDTSNLQIRRGEVLLHLARKRYNVTTESGDNMVDEEYETKQCSVLKVGRIDRNEKPTIQIMVTDAPTPNELLANFDVSTHAVAVDMDGTVYRHDGWTPPQVPPVALLNHSTTPRRMERIAARFGHAITEEIPF